MKKHKLIIASVLKPVDDTRMYEKFGLSLSQTNKYEINIIGFYVKKTPQHDNIFFHPIFNFRRLNISRLLAPLKCFVKYIKLKPKVIIINTHELLIVTALYKILFGAKVIYDVRENYFRNILFTNAFPLLIRPIIAGYVRGKEYLSRLLFDHYFLAERAYAEEFSFSQGRSTIIENKYKPLEEKKTHEKTTVSSSKISLIFTGTLAESTGVFECIEIAKKLHEKNARIELKIVGYCSMSSTLERLQKIVAEHPYISLSGGAHLVSHSEVLSAIKSADFGMVYYPWNRSTMNTMPTKIFEYLGNHLPMLLQNHQPWTQLCQKYSAAITISPEQFDAEKTLHKMLDQKFYTTIPGEEILWVSEEKKLLEITNKYIS